MHSFSSISVIFNPNSTGNAKRQAEDLKSTLAPLLPDLPVQLLPTTHAGHAIELAYETAKSAQTGDFPLIISASGDGGYNEVINGALRAQHEGATPVCAVLPSGNANDHARTMHDDELADLIVKGDIKMLDLLQVTATAPDGTVLERYAHSYIGLGLTPVVAVELNKYTLNSFKEAWIILKTFWNLRPVIIRTPDKTMRIDSLICSLIPEMAKVLTISDKAEQGDGMFELTIFPHNHKFKLIWRLLKGVVSNMEAQSRQHDYECSILQDVPIQLDGEILEFTKNTRLQVSLCPQYIRTLIS